MGTKLSALTPQWSVDHWFFACSDGSHTVRQLAPPILESLPGSNTTVYTVLSARLRDGTIFHVRELMK